MIKRTALALCALLAVVAIAVPLWVATHRADLASPGDDDLLVEPVDLPPDQNALRHFVSAVERMDWPEEGEPDDVLQAIYDGERWEPEWVADRVRRNAGAFAALEEGLATPALQHPKRTIDELGLEPWSDLARLTKLAGAGARLLSERGEYLAALDRALLGLRVGQKISEGSGAVLLDMMMAVMHQTIGASVLDRVVRQTPLAPEQARELAERIDSLRIEPSSWRAVWAAEYRWGKGMLLEDAAENAYAYFEGEPLGYAMDLLPADYLWQPNRTLASLARHYRDKQTAATRPCAANAWEDSRPSSTLAALLDGNPIGHALASMWSSGDPYDSRRCAGSTWISLAQSSIGIKAHRDRNGGLPEHLEDLVPEYLDSVPLDGFDGKPLRYSNERELVWSIGSDFIDDSGSEGVRVSSSRRSPSRYELHPPQSALRMERRDGFFEVAVVVERVGGRRVADEARELFG